MTISLAVVFIPILFMEGLLGRLFREFAVTIGVAVLISGAIALSMTPMMCSLMLKPSHSHGRVYQWLERVFDAARNGYGSSLRWTMRHRGLMLAGSAAFLVLIVVVYKLVPHGFIPRQDTGVIFGNTRAPEGVTSTVITVRGLSGGRGDGCPRPRARAGPAQRVSLCTVCWRSHRQYFFISMRSRSFCLFFIVM